MPLATGFVLENRYRIVELLGQGGFGAVYRAWDTKLNGSVAVKESFETSPTAQRQFELEAQLLFKLRHPNLPRVIDQFIIPGKGQYLVMDYIEGEDLAEMLLRRGEALPQEDVYNWLGQVCDALGYLHTQSPAIIHRDIKPSNIRITPQGQAMLVDFGIAKIFDPDTKTTTGARAVTPGYSPPEQFGSGTTDSKSDIYALGATAYHLLTGKRPPMAMDITAGNADAPSPAHTVNPLISPQISAAIEQAMKLNRSERLESIMELRRALVGTGPPGDTFVVAGQSDSQPAVALAGQDAPKPKGRGRYIWIALSIIFGVFICMAILSRLGQRANNQAALSTQMATRRSGQADAAETPFETKETTEEESSQTPRRTPIQETRTPIPLPQNPITANNADKIEELGSFDVEFLDQAVWSPRGDFLAMAAGTGIYLIETNREEQAHAVELGSWDNTMAFSQNGTMLATGSGDNSLRVWSLEDGRVISQMRGHTAQVFSVAFGRFGRLLASGSADQTVRLWGVEDGVRQRSLLGHTDTVYSVFFIPNMERLASGSADKTVRVWQTKNGEPLQVLEGHEGIVYCVVYSADAQYLASGSSDTTIRLWDAASGELANTLEGHSDSVLSLAFSTDNNLLATGSADKTVRLWRVSDGVLLRTLEGHFDAVHSVSFSPDGLYLVSGSSSQLIMWGIAP